MRYLVLLLLTCSFASAIATSNMFNPVIEVDSFHLEGQDWQEFCWSHKLGFSTNEIKSKIIDSVLSIELSPSHSVNRSFQLGNLRFPISEKTTDKQISELSEVSASIEPAKQVLLKEESYVVSISIEPKVVSTSGLFKYDESKSDPELAKSLAERLFPEGVTGLSLVTESSLISAEDLFCSVETKLSDFRKLILLSMKTPIIEETYHLLHLNAFGNVAFLRHGKNPAIAFTFENELQTITVIYILTREAEAFENLIMSNFVLLNHAQ
ncbi:MAG: hypothetical protein AAF197_08005 [Pseudomonadota bacterium]